MDRESEESDVKNKREVEMWELDWNEILGELGLELDEDKKGLG